MKLHTDEYQDKLSSLEDGSIRYEIMKDGFNSNRNQRGNNYSRCFQFMKVILYLELVLFVGWIGCIFLSNYYQIYEHRGSDEYGGLKSSQDHDSLTSVMNSDSVSSTEIIRSAQQDVMKTTSMRREPFTESVNQETNIVSETEMMTTKNVIDVDDGDMDASMIYPNWDSLQSIQVQNDKPPLVFPTHLFDDGLTLNTDSVTSLPLTNHFDSMNINNEDYFDDFNTWKDTEYMDILSDINRDVLRNARLSNFKFDSGRLESVDWNQWFHPSHEASTSVDHEEHSFELSSEETHNPTWKKKRSTESSSSEETTTQASMVKRSAESSSSSSDSSASSSGNEETTKEVVQEENNCPKILDEQGNPVQDPKKIIHYIKRNWFDWILENPIPECIQPKFERTVNFDKCGRLIITCTLDESSEIEDTSKEPATNKRSIRSFEENNQQDNCAGLVKASRDLEAWRDTILVGKNDPAVKKFYKDFAIALMPLALQEIVELSTGEQTNMDEHWQNSVMEIKQNISKSTEHCRILEENTAAVEEMTNELRSMVESIVNKYKKCNFVEITSEEAKRAMSAIRMLIERERCTKSFDRMETKLNSLAAEIVKGESSDQTVKELRGRFKNIVLSLSMVINSNERRTPKGQFPTGPVNVTDEQWRTHMIGLKQEISKASEDPVIRQQLEADSSPTQEQANQLREIVEYILRGWSYCYRVSFFGSRGRAKHAESNKRMMRNSTS